MKPLSEFKTNLNKNNMDEDQEIKIKENEAKKKQPLLGFCWQIV